jgi:hypothetical protein
MQHQHNDAFKKSHSQILCHKMPNEKNSIKKLLLRRRAAHAERKKKLFKEHRKNNNSDKLR